MPINDLPAMGAPPVVTVSQVNNVVASVVKADRRLADVCVKGEISQFTRNAKSGHLYFTIKDSSSTLKCVMFAFNARSLRFQPQVGMTVICKGAVGVYVPYGDYSLQCTAILPEGEGAQAAALEELKRRLEAEGLFSQHRPIPAAPRCIAVVTSPTGAALQDIINVISRRYPLTRLVVVPTQVQGAAAPQLIAAAIKRAATTGADTIIFGRGGGATDDLEAFNSEIVARAVFASPIPTISAVGHQINSTVADLAADKYAPTPSAAAEIAVPDISMYGAALDDTRRRLSRNMQQRFRELESSVGSKAELVRALSPEARLSALQQRVEGLNSAIRANVHNRLSAAERGVNASAGVISALNPLAILARGYSVTESGGRILDTVEGLSSGDELRIRLADGTVTAQVMSIERNNNTDGI